MGRLIEFLLGLSAGVAALALLAVLATASSGDAGPEASPVMAASVAPEPEAVAEAGSGLFAALGEALRPQSRPRQSRVTVRRHGQLAARSCRPTSRFVRAQ